MSRSEQSISLSFVHILHIPRRSGPLKLWTTSRTLNEFNDERQNTYSDYHIAAVTHTKNDETDLIPLTYWQEYLDMIQLFKIITDITYVDKNIVPKVKKTRRSTRSGNNTDGIIVLEEELYRTSTYARSYLVRSRRVWNKLPNEMRRNSISLATFKTLLKQYYSNALNSCYDTEDARTWKTVCVKCNTARNLLTAPSCCF